MGRPLRVALIGGVALAIGGSVAYATGLSSLGFVGSDGTITACVQTSNGNVRFIDPSSSSKDVSACRTGEAQLTLNQRGPSGPPGPGASTDPVFVDVDCDAGQSVQAAIQASSPLQPLTVDIHGTCNEGVFIRRDNVTLQANAPGDGLAPPAGHSGIFINGARGIELDGLTITGGQDGISATGGASFEGGGLSIVSPSGGGIEVGQGATGDLHDTVVENSGNEGIQAHNSGSLTFSGGRITGSNSFAAAAQGAASLSLFNGTIIDDSHNIAVYAAFRGSVDVASATIENNNGPGAMAGQAGSIHFFANGGPILIEDNGQQGVSIGLNGSAQLHGVTVSGNAHGGVIAYSGGTVQVEDSTITANGDGGINFGGAASGEITNTTISNNSGDGVHISGTSEPSFGFPSGNDTITGNTGWGVTCDGVARFDGAPGSVTGNGGGQINCP